ncbi:MAG: NAD(P)/FAD-dependent oxidoreductase [Chlamydiia bacterium]|nr:NAD(P)/FAD-dependent oxidoreductase [Chlamydiia bacterium]
MSVPKVLIIGGGFGGLAVAKGLRCADVTVTLIDKTNYHLFQPLLYQVASAALSPGDIAAPIRSVLRHQENTTVLMGGIDKIDLDRQVAFAHNGDEFPFDILVVATGAHHSYFGHEEWESLAPGIKTLADALTIRQRILVAFERAERSNNPEEIAGYLNFVIVGGGPTGVELAGAVAEIAHKSLLKEFRRIDPNQAKVYLIEGAPRLLSAYPEDLSERARKDLEELGVVVITGAHVTNITEDGVYIGERFIPTSTVTWAAGNSARTKMLDASIPRDRAGRIYVESDLSLKDYPNVFVIGDAACAIDPATQKPLPGIAPVALQQGRFLAKVIAKNLPREERPEFHYHDKGYMATIGKARAVAVMGRWKFTGFLAWLAWCLIHVLYLINFRNKLAVMSEWVFCYITGKRPVRIIHRDIFDAFCPVEPKPLEKFHRQQKKPDHS